MTSNELRIGNYYQYAGDNGIIYTKVKEIKHNQFGLLGDFDGVNFEICKPIELTEEWLLKFGFIQQGVIINNNGLTEQCGINYFIKNNIVYSLSDNQVELDNPNVFLCNLKYVHQLQNLYFALTGKELTFESE